MSPALPKKFGNWEVIRKEGSGGFSSAYLAKHIKGGKKAIIKQLDPQEQNKLGARDLHYFVREAKILSELDSKYISKLLDFDFKAAKPWMAVQYFPGTTLWDYIEQGSVASEAQWFQMAHDIMSGLAYAHSKGVVHRDLNPKNIILFYEGARLIDFGLSRFTDDPNSTRIIGFNGFVAPEVELGDPKPSLDIFVAATALSAAGTGRMPWRAEGGSYHKSIVTDSPDYKGLTKNQILLLSKMHSKKPGERITAKQALKLIEELAPTTAGVQIAQAKRVNPVVPKSPLKDPSALKKAGKADEAVNVAKRGDNFVVTPKVPAAQREYGKVDTWIRAHKLLTIFAILTGGWALLVYAILKNLPKNKSLTPRALDLLTINYGFMFAGFGLLSPFISNYWGRKSGNKALKILGLTQLAAWATFMVAAINTPTGESAPGWTSWLFFSLFLSNFVALKPIRAAIAGTSSPAQENIQPNAKLETPREEYVSDANVTNAHASWEEVENTFRTILSKVGNKKFVIGVEGIHLKGVFLQGYSEPDGSKTVEAAADLSVRPRISTEQRSNLNSLGWDSPDEGLPNFIQFLSIEESEVEYLANLFTKTLRDGYGFAIGTFKVIQ